MLAQTVCGEARGCAPEEQKLVVWCILNRVDAWEQSITDVILAKNQFQGYSVTCPIELEICDLCEEVLLAWEAGEEAPTLEPYATGSNYLWFTGDGEHNWFREVY